MKKLKKLSDIPSWFDIAKYDKATSFGIKEWHQHISDRVRVNISIESKTIDLSDTTLIDFLIDKWISNIKIDPTSWMEEPALPKEIFNSDNFMLIPKFSEDSVRNFTLSDLFARNITLSKVINDTKLVSFLKGEYFDEMPMSIEQFYDLSNKPIETDSSWFFFKNVSLTVNLHASDKQLLDDFKSWLRQTRIRLDHRTKEDMFTDVDFNNWCKYAILPYYDLTLWAKMNNVEFTNAILGEVLFPDAGIEGFDGESRIRRETKRRSDEIFTFETTKVLEAQIK
jgi:hypothetical protein